MAQVNCDRHVEIRALRTWGLLISKAGVLLAVGNVTRISRLIFPASLTGVVESSMYTNDCPGSFICED